MEARSGPIDDLLSMICTPPQRPAVPNFGFPGAVFNPSVTETVPFAGGWVTVTVTPRALHALFQNVGRESTNSEPESTVRQTVPGEVGASSLADAASATSRGPVAPPNNNAATMIARVMIDPSVAPSVGTPIGRRRSGGGSRRYDNVTSALGNVPYGTPWEPRSLRTGSHRGSARRRPRGLQGSGSAEWPFRSASSF